VKRALDILLVLAAAPLVLPLGLLMALTVFLFLGRPVFFVSERAGKGGRPFRMLKFRTMRLGAGSDAARLTRIGRILRAASLDELPQLLHILSGTMAFVGPRPLPIAYVARYSSEQARRLEVRPGLTGWAQVNGRNALSWEEKFRLDVWYVDHQSIFLDMKILALTFVRLLSAAGINHPGYDTMCEFKGDAP